jgi:predicted RNase H-like nuclease (RuvC/YqgF family)
MKDTLDKIAQMLPDGFSETGLEEVKSIVEAAINEAVSQEKKLLEAKVSGFLRTRISDLKDVAQQELEANDEVIRGYRIYESIRALVAKDVESEDVDTVVSQQETEIAELKESLNAVNERLSNSLHENTMLADKVSSLNEANEQLTESAKLPFKSSESAVVITNETDSSRPSSEAVNNIFLTEDVINLAKQEVLKD